MPSTNFVSTKLTCRQTSKNRTVTRKGKNIILSLAFQASKTSKTFKDLQRPSKTFEDLKEPSETFEDLKDLQRPSKSFMEF
jgi:hypothetical protein